MDRTLKIALTVAAVAIVAILVFTMATHNEQKDDDSDLAPIELTFSFDESKLKVVSEGKNIKDKDVFTFNGDSKFTVSTVDGSTMMIVANGQWSNSYGMSGSSEDSKYGSDLTVDIVDCIYFEKATGTMNIMCSNDEGASDLAPIKLTFSIDPNVKVMHGGDEIKDGDVYTFTGDSILNATTVDGLEHTIAYSGSWSNPDGMSSGANGYELGTSTKIEIMDTMYWSEATGTMTIDCTGDTGFYDYASIILTFEINDSKLKVVAGDGTVLKNGDTHAFPGDVVLNVTVLDGSKTRIVYGGYWSNSYGMADGAAGDVFESSTTLRFTNNMVFDDARGSLQIVAPLL